jgi:PKD repeat protein
LGSIRSYHWDFGDGQTSSEQNPSHLFAKDSTYYVCLTIYDGSNCSYTFCKYLDVTDAIPVVSADNNWIVYPNPFGNELYVESKTLSNQAVEEDLYDVLGRRMFSEVLPGKSVNPLRIDVSGLSDGMYLLEIKTTNADYVQRIIKQ